MTIATREVSRAPREPTRWLDSFWSTHRSATTRDTTRDVLGAKTASSGQRSPHGYRHLAGSPESTATASPLGADSKVGTLRRLILHRPDVELRRPTPRSRETLLFDDVIWVRRTRQEHVRADHLAGTLENDTARDALHDWFRALPAEEVH